MSTVLTELFLIGALVLAAWRLPALHPVTLWCASWAAAGFLFMLDLLPYKPLSTATSLLICGATIAFALGAISADRLVERFAGDAGNTTEPPDDRARESRALERAAICAAAVAGLILAAFIVQQARKFGVINTFRVSIDIRRDLGTGSSGLTVKYIYPAVAAAALAATAAARKPTLREARPWIALAAASACSTYFATGRGTIVVAVAVATFAYWLGAERLPRRRTLLASGAALAALAFVALVAIGQIQGKNQSSILPELPSAFADHESIQPLAMPYQYASAALGGLNEQVAVASTWGESHGCATGNAVCSALNRAGIASVEPRPLVRPFTATPLRWNLYTSLDLPLLDGGLVFAIPIVALTGFGFGLLWGLARRRSSVGQLAYSIGGPTLLFAGSQYGFLAPHIVGGILIAVGLLVGWRWIAQRAGGSRGARPATA